MSCGQVGREVRGDYTAGNGDIEERINVVMN
jgi:hypothetical protein